MRKRLVMILSAVLILPILLPGSASAGNRNQPFFADFNHDGRLDRAALGHVGTTKTCTVSIEIKKSDGTYKAPKVHSYTSPAASGPYCPDFGEAIDLGGDGSMEIVTAWWTSPTGYHGKMLVLRHFQPFATYQGIGDQSTLRKVDFDGDGLEDIWESSDQSSRLAAFRNDASGALVPGPFNVCSMDPIPQHAFADFNGDGGQDMLVSRRCAIGSLQGTYAQVLFGNAAPTAVLAFSAASNVRYEVYVTDLHSDTIPDAGVIERNSAGTVLAVRHFRNDGAGNFTEEP